MEFGSFDTSLLEVAIQLFKFLVIISLVSLILGILTLPIFVGVTRFVSTWFWSLDEGNFATVEGRSPIRGIFALILKFLIPIVSVAASIYLSAYFGLLDFVSSDGKLGIQVTRQFEDITRSMAEATNPPESDVSTWTAEEKEGRELMLKQAVKPFRIVCLMSLIVVGPFPSLVIVLSLIFGRKGITLILRSLSRNFLRTALTYLAVFVLSTVISAIWSILSFLGNVTAEKESNLKAIITEKNQIPSQMKPTHEKEVLQLIEEITKRDPNVKLVNGDNDIMTWAFVGGTTDPANRSFQNSVFFFAMQPAKLLTMMDGLDELTGEQRQQLEAGVASMESNPRAVIMGKQRLQTMQKRVGDRIRITSLNYKDITFDFEIIGEFPEGRYDQSAVMNRDYLYRSLEEYEGRNGKIHPLADKCLNLIWVKLPTKQAFEAVAAEVNNSGKFVPAVKMETASSGIGSFLDSFKDQLWALKWILTPALLIAMTVIISNAISITVRERQKEMAVLKVLGFRPWMVLYLVLGEALLLGLLSGFMATSTAYVLVNSFGGLAFPIAFFPKFLIPAQALVWGAIIGSCSAALGSILPAWSARSVKVSDVFARVS